MTYFIDFDDTLFDTPKYVEYLRLKSGVLNPNDKLSEAELFNLLKQNSSTHERVFAPGELAQFLYFDVPEFLRAMGNEATIITQGDPEVQKIKVQSALFGIPRVNTFYTGAMSKGEYLVPRIEAYIQPVFIDNSAEELGEVARLLPNISLYEMRRDGAAAHGHWPVLHALGRLG